RLNRRPYFHFLFHRHLLLQRPIEARPADLRQPARSLDTQAALHGHQLPDSVVDAFSPEPLLLRRRASTFCKAPLKKSTSSAFSPSTRFSSRISFRSSRSPEFAARPGPSSTGSIWSRHLYNWVRWIPSSAASSVAFLQLFSRSNAIFRNAVGYLLTCFFLLTRSSFPCKV